MNSSGKVLTIFLVIIAILLISLTAISLFFFQKETERRKLVEATLKEFQAEKTKLEEDFAEMKKQNFLLQEKKKEADDRVNDLSDELELEKGLREETKLETTALQEQLEQIQAEKEELAKQVAENDENRTQLTTSLEVSEQKVRELEAQLKAESERAQKLGELYEKQKQEMSELEKKTSAFQDVGTDWADYTGMPAGEGFSNENKIGNTDVPGVELDEIVVVPGENIDDLSMESSAAVFDSDSEGRILSVDVETEFVILSLGEMDGIEIGDVLSVYRDDDYIGDIRITRLQPEMSAADLIPPFSIKKVKKDDLIKAKQ